MGCRNSVHYCVRSQQNHLDDDRPTLTEHQKKLLLNTWQVLQQDIAKVGVVMFMNVFETHPECKEAFLPFKELKGNDLRWSTELKTHGLRVMNVVEKILARIESEEKIEEYLKALACKHVNYGANPKLMHLFGPQFIHAIKRPINEHWSPEMQEAWTTFFDTIVYYLTLHMYNNMPGSKAAQKTTAKYVMENGQM